MKHIKIIEQMTLAEKAAMLSGANFWNTEANEALNIPSIMMTDGPHGLRKQGGKADHLGLNKSLPATCYPTAATLANSWDKEVINKVGTYLAQECLAEEVSIILGPGLNIKRHPLCGRNFEYFSEDPYLSGKLATALVKGIQAEGVAACPKHFAVNSQEHMRMSIDEVVDERALREIYLRGFEEVVKEGQPKTIMSAYNRVNGIYANEHPHLMNDILYDEWGFKGVMITDWGGNNDRVAGLLAGNQLEMPSTNGITDRELIKAVEEKRLSESVIDEAVERMLELVFETVPQGQPPVIDYDKHHQQAVEAAKRSIVLLKNDEQILPLQASEKVAIIGDFAKIPRFQGAGSSLINPTKEPSPLEALGKMDLNIIGYRQGFKRMGKKSSKLLKEAVSLAQQADKVLVFLGLDESLEAEGIDRENLRLRENQLELVAELIKVTPNLIVVLAGGGVIELPFADEVKGIIHTYLAGQGSGEGLGEILTGQYNPGGKLSESFPYDVTDVSANPYYPGLEATAEHRESLFVGYRYFDTAEVPVRYPFGFGLSYTTFAYSDIQLESLELSFTITNTGQVTGEEVAQLYIQKEDSQIFRAKRELRGFEKVSLEPQESKRISLTLIEEDFYYYSIEKADWAIEGGSYALQVSSALGIVQLETKIELTSKNQTEEYSQENYPLYFSGKVHEISDIEYHQLLGYQPPAPLWDTEKPLEMSDTIAQAKSKNWLGKSTYNLVIGAKNLLSLLNNPIWSNNMYFVLNLPFRQIERFTGGKISEKAVKRYLKWINR